MNRTLQFGLKVLLVLGILFGATSVLASANYSLDWELMDNGLALIKAEVTGGDPYAWVVLDLQTGDDGFQLDENGNGSYSNPTYITPGSPFTVSVIGCGEEQCQMVVNIPGTVTVSEEARLSVQLNTSDIFCKFIRPEWMDEAATLKVMDDSNDPSAWKAANGPTIEVKMSENIVFVNFYRMPANSWGYAIWQTETAFIPMVYDGGELAAKNNYSTDLDGHCSVLP